MKNLILIPATITLLLLGACERDWVCRCTDQDGDEVNHEQTGQTLNQARTECEAREFDQTILGIHTSNTCELK